MISTNAKPFGKLLTAMVTPFNDELKIDFPAVERLLEHFIATGSDGVVVSGTTGESPTLDDEEKQELLKFVVKRVKGRLSIVMGTGSNDTQKSIKASKQAADLGADGLLVVAPYYNKPNQDGLRMHFTSIASTTSLPVIIYNIPGRTGINVSVETTVALANECPTIAALKDSTGSVEQAQDIGRLAPSSFQVYSGDDYLTLPFLSVGACGVVSVASHLVGTEIQRMITAFRENRPEEARTIHYEWLPLFKGLFLAPNPTCVKYALSRLGIMEPHLRLPLVPLNEAHRQAIDNLIKSETIQKQARSLTKS